MCVEVIFFTEFIGEGNTSQILAPLAGYWVDVEQDHQPCKQPHEGDEEDHNLTSLAVQVKSPKADVGEECKRQEEPADEAGDVGKVVDPREEAEGKEEEDQAHQLDEGLPRPRQDLPTLEELDKKAGEDAKL